MQLPHRRLDADHTASPTSIRHYTKHGLIVPPMVEWTEDLDEGGQFLQATTPTVASTKNGKNKRSTDPGNTQVTSLFPEMLFELVLWNFTVDLYVLILEGKKEVWYKK